MTPEMIESDLSQSEIYEQDADLSDLPAEYCLGYAAIDRDHAELFGIMAKLETACGIPDMGGRRLRPILLSLQAYVDAHFESEEEIMHAAAYPGLQEHTKHHLAMRRGLQTLGTLIDYGFSEAADCGVQMLRLWIESHMDTYDRQFVDFHRQRTRTQ